jgi:prepilin-type N-terminal cleavage/methylation domain-containing protein
MKTNARAGVTLLEMIVAVSLLSLLSVGMLIAMRLGFNTMDKVNSHLVLDRRVVNSRGIIENEISGFIFTMADFMPGSPGFRTVPFIEAEPQSMRFVTSYSLNDGWRGRPQIAVLQVIPGDIVAGDSRRGVRLIVNESPYTGPVQAGQTITGIEADAVSRQPVTQFLPVAPGPQSFVLADRLAFCRFVYLQPLPDAPFQLWRPDWVLPGRLPLAIRIEMDPLDTGASSLHVTTVTVPLHVTRNPGSAFADSL